MKKNSNFIDNCHPVIISLSFCENIPEKIQFPGLKPFRLYSINMTHLDAPYKLDQYSRGLDEQTLRRQKYLMTKVDHYNCHNNNNHSISPENLIYEESKEGKRSAVQSTCGLFPKFLANIGPSIKLEVGDVKNIRL